MAEKKKFDKISVEPNVKQEIDIIAAKERRHVYQLVAEMLKLYKHVNSKPVVRKKVVKDIPVSEFIAPDYYIKDLSLT